MPKVNPKVLKWARETAGLSPQDAARKLGLKATKDQTPSERIETLEAGDKQPSVALLRKMAKQYRRPLVSLYLAKSPARGERGEDFRTLPDADHKISDPLVDALLRDIKARQDMVRVLLRDEEYAEPLSFIASANVSDGVQTVARAITTELKFDLGTFRSSKTVEQAFGYLRYVSENSGIFVLLAGNLGSHHTTIDVKFFRGFALADKIAPLVLINDQDAKSAWAFTLLHELAHLWLGKSGISGEVAESQTEKFCSDVASSILLPDLSNFAFSDGTDFEARTEEVSQFAQQRRVSASMVGYRLFLAGRLSQTEWRKLSAYFRQQWVASRDRIRERSKEAEGGPNYYVVRRHRVGAALLDLVARSMSAGTLTPTKAGKVLGVKPRSVAPLLSGSSRSTWAA
jgi:Zn-dependent peptidase ImmA (M78 family)/transcriptional regulator with XRE-family HTH domain